MRTENEVMEVVKIRLVISKMNCLYLPACVPLMFLSKENKIVTGSLICANYVSTRFSSLNNLVSTLIDLHADEFSHKY